MQGVELSRVFYEECLLPLIRQRYPEIEGAMAVGVLGMGSDASGLDDDLSREHHWGPRCNFLLADPLRDRCAEIETFLQQSAPRAFRGYAVYHLKYNRCGISVETVSDFFTDLVGRAEAPDSPAEWLTMTEADLYHATHGAVFYDGPGELTRRRAGLAYYPDPVWRKKLADWLVYLTGHGVYNINRARLRQDWATASIYFGVTVKRILETGHLLNRTYAPYNKWLYRSFQRLPVFAGETLPLLDQALTAASWEEKCLLFLRIKVAINDELHRQGLARLHYPPRGEVEITEPWMYYLYDAAVDLYRSLPDAQQPLVWGRFNEVEKWETVVKQVLLLASDWKEGFPDLDAPER